MNPKIKSIVFKCTRLIGRILYKRRVWLISDRQFIGGDNGEAFFTYLQSQNVNSIFAISKQSQDYQRLKAIGQVVPYHSIRHRLLLCICDVNVSSQLFHMENHKEQPQIFLQHGVAIHDMHGYLNPSSHKNLYIITVSDREQEAFYSSLYTIPKTNVLLTGLPRYDYYYNNMQNKIVVSFTWRSNLSTVTVEEIKTSIYFQMYQQIFNDELLIKKIESYGYKLCFKLHPLMLNYLQAFDIPQNIEILTCSYQKLFAECNLLITDYSSIALDFAYLMKPVIYYQFDEKDFFNGEHTCQKGYFSYKEDGFGEVIYNYSEFCDMIIRYLENECKMSDTYANRVKRFFSFTDQNNCERVYQEIKRIIYL